MVPVLIIIALLVAIVLYVISVSNGIVRRRNEAQNAWSQIDVFLKRKANLIPNLVETVKGYAAHERETLMAITEARASLLKATSAGDPQAAAVADQQLRSNLSMLFTAVNENYPELKSDGQFMRLQEELVSTENQVARARQGYNDAVTIFHNAIDMFPGSVIAGSKYARMQLFELPAESRVASDDVRVAF